MIKLDHLAVACETLEAGRAAVEAALDVPLQPGGEHPVFHTHNLLLGLEDGLYLEVIAINHNAPKPERPRWFDMDRFRGLPRMTNWICQTEDLPATLQKAPKKTGEPVALTRGDLRWDMAVPGDGILPFANLFPALIQWHGDVHPAPLLVQQGVKLRQLVIESPDAATLSGALGLLDDPRVKVEQSARAALHAQFDTPGGLRWL